MTNGNRFQGAIVLRLAERFSETTQVRAMIKTFRHARPTAMFRASLLEHKRASRLMRTTWAVLCMGLAMSMTQAQTPGKVDAEIVELAAQLLGASVLAEGKEVGKLADISIGDDGRIDKIRISTAAKLGLGVRIEKFAQVLTKYYAVSSCSTFRRMRWTACPPHSPRRMRGKTSSCGPRSRPITPRWASAFHCRRSPPTSGPPTIKQR